MPYDLVYTCGVHTTCLLSCRFLRLCIGPSGSLSYVINTHTGSYCSSILEKTVKANMSELGSTHMESTRLTLSHRSRKKMQTTRTYKKVLELETMKRNTSKRMMLPQW